MIEMTISMAQHGQKVCSSLESIFAANTCLLGKSPLARPNGIVIFERGVCAPGKGEKFHLMVSKSSKFKNRGHLGMGQNRNIIKSCRK